MFNYLSFLRPPPQQASSSLPVTITPRLANDLRTELSDSTQDIFYSWSLLTQLTSNYPTATKPRKLTTWRAESAYKEILVPLPPGLRDGQSYSLVLTVHDQGVPHVVNLARPSCGARPLPVMSMPILFTRGRQDPGKQEQIQRVYRIPTSPGNQVFLTVTEQTSFDLDKKIWDSGIGLSSWIVDLASGVVEYDGLQDLKSKLIETSTNVLELGAGTGIVALAIGALRSESTREASGSDGSILTTDLSSAMPLLEHNISRNEKLFTSPAIRPQAVVLDWDEPLPDEVHAVEGGFDVIVMADVTYNTASFPSLIATLKSLIDLQDHSNPPLFLLGYKERDPAERMLWDRAREIGIEFKQVGEREGAGGAPVEIWLGRVVVDATS